MNNKVFSDEIIQMCIDLHHSQGRTKWKYEPITKKQKFQLFEHIPKEKLNQIDRGAAAILISHLFEMCAKVSGWTEEDNK